MKVIITDEAFESLEDIVVFISHSSNESKALAVGTALINLALTLDTMSLRGPIEVELIGEGGEYRRLIFEHRYKVIYRVADNVVYVLRFFDTRQNPSKMKG